VESIPARTAKRGRAPSSAGRHVIDSPFRFDEIGKWSELKLEIVEKYGAAYTKAFANFRGLKKYTSTASAVRVCTFPRRPARPSRAAPRAP
jgi:hypothetical protein